MIKKENFLIFLIFILVLVISLSYLKFGIDFPPPSDAIRWYDPLALSLAKNQGFKLAGTPTAATSPGYPFFLSLIYKTFGQNYQVVKFFQFLLLAGIAILVFITARNLLNLSLDLAFLSSLTVLIWPYFILYSALIATEILFIFLFVLAIYFLLRFGRNQAYLNYVFSGIFLGLAMLVRPVIFLLPFWFFFFLFLSRKRIKIFDLKKLIIFLFVVYLVISPWILRNFLEFGKFLPIMEWPSLKKAYITLSYTQGSIPLKPEEATLKTMILARVKNIYLFWNPGAEGERAQTLIKNWPLMVYFFLIYKILFFSILGLAFLSLRFIKIQKEVFLLWTIIFYFWALHIVLFPYPRYTLPIIPLVIILAFFSLSSFLPTIKFLLRRVYSK